MSPKTIKPLGESGPPAPLQGASPVVHQFYPIASPAGGVLIVTGSGFTSGAQVFFGGTRLIPSPNVSVVSPTLLQVEIPSSGTLAANINGYLTVMSGGNTITTQNLPASASNPGNPASTYPDFVLLGDASQDGLIGASDYSLARAFSLFQVTPTPTQVLACDLVPTNGNGSFGDGNFTATDLTLLRAILLSQATFCSSNCLAPSRVQFSETATYQIQEGNAGSTLVTITAERTGDTGKPASFTYQVTDGTAGQSSGDYSGATLSPVALEFAAGETTKTFSITVNGDTAIESDETIILTLTPVFQPSSTYSNPCIAGPDRTKQTIQFTIANDDACAAISILPASLGNGTQGTAYPATTLTASGGVAPHSFSIASGSLPDGMTLASTGLLSGTTTATGTANFTVRATDSRGCLGTQAYTLTIDAGSGCNNTLVISTPSGTTLPTGKISYGYRQVFSFGNGVEPLIFTTAGQVPPGLGFAQDRGMWVLTGNPTTVGQYTFRVTVTDGDGKCFSQQYSLRVITCPNIVVGTSGNLEGTVGAAYFARFTPGGGTAPYSFTSNGSLPAGLTFNPDGTITGTPTQTGSSNNFSVSATDANGCLGSNTFSVNVIVACGNVTLGPATLSNGQTGQPYSQVLTVGGGTGTYTFAVDGGRPLPDGLALHPSGNTATLSGTPTRAATFTFIIAVDSGGCRTAREYTITISGVGGECPGYVLSPDTLPPATVGQPYSVTFSAGQLGSFTYSATTTLPNWLTLTPGGMLSGTPPAAGAVTIGIRATETAGCFTEKTYTLNIVASGCPTITLGSTPNPLPSGTTGTAYAGAVFTASPAGTYTYRISVGALPAGLTLATNGQLTGTPTAAGDSTFTVEAKDAADCVGTRQFAISIGQPSGGTGQLQLTASSATVTEGGTVTLTISRVGGTSGVLTGTYSVVGGKATGNDIDYRVTGSGNVTFNASDAAPQTFQIIVRDDLSVECSENIIVRLADSNGGVTTVTVTIQDNDTLDDVVGACLRFKGRAVGRLAPFQGNAKAAEVKHS